MKIIIRKIFDSVERIRTSYFTIACTILVIVLPLNVQCELNFNRNDVTTTNNKNFKSVPTTVKTFENDTVLLPCYHIAPYRYIRWHKDDILLVDSRYPDIPPPERVHLWTNGSLQVSRVKSEDTGEYYCEIVGTSNDGSSGHSIQAHAIEVQYPPTVISSPSGTVEVPIGSVFEIVCEAKGVPYPIINWRRNGVYINSDKLENKRRLLVEVDSRDISGPIECIATNGVGEPAISGIHLNVLFQPEVKAISNVVHTKINLRAHLECQVVAAPAATVHWFHHGVPVTTTDLRIARHDNEIQSNNSITHYYTESKHTLIIKKVKDHDLGMYECRAENKIGFKGVVIELTGKPMVCIFKTSSVSASTSTTHSLIWQTESLSPIIEYKLRFRQVPSGNITPQNRPINLAWTELTIPADLSEGPIHSANYILRGLQPASVYEVSVLSRNRYGWSDNSKIVRFATGGEIEVPSYSTESDIRYDDDDEIDEVSNFLTDFSPPSSMPHEYSSRSMSNAHSNYKLISCTIFILFLICIVRS